MPIWMVEAVEDEARDLGMSRSEFIRFCVEFRLEDRAGRRRLQQLEAEIEQRVRARES